MLKISSIHHFILEKEQILESHDLKGQVHFDHAHPLIIKGTFSFPELISACKKSLNQSWDTADFSVHDLKIYANFRPNQPNSYDSNF